MSHLLPKKIIYNAFSARKVHEDINYCKSKGVTITTGINTKIFKPIEFIREKRFPSCKYKIPLPFDFYIPSKKILIEYDGEQHFSSVDIWGGKKGLKERVLKDKIKIYANLFLFKE